MAEPSAIDRPQRFPPQIKFLAWNEACERFSYYGVTSVLTIHMVRNLLLRESSAEAAYHLFGTAVYLTPLLGAWVADRFWGRYRTVFWLSFAYVLGHATIAAFESPAGLFAGLALIAVGAGGIKPCAAAFVGDQFTRENRGLLKKVYDLYYWMINLGSTVGTLAIPLLLDRVGPRVAFGLPGLAMAVALLVFWLGRRRYRYLAPSGPRPHGFLAVVRDALAARGAPAAPGAGLLSRAATRHPPEAIAGARAVLGVCGIFAPIVGFWALFFQYGSSWVLQAERMDREVLGLHLASSQVSFLNSIFVMALIPLFAGGLYPWLERRGVQVTALRKMGAGMFVTVLSFVAAWLVEHALEAGIPVSVAWQVPQYLFVSMGEVLVSVTALEFAYTQAPPTMKSTIMGLWYFAIGLGNFVTALVSAANRFHGTAYFAFFAWLMLGCALWYVAVARRYRGADWPVAGEEAA
ncbi:POT family MFS transporter [Anaeromyxobacter paludicola]|uniref:MFS transporter n=1 Tax=Anaeromyxobacter paludicola TaxID=2918171 RepID=A0ABM7XBW0_9BACT|nr:POT family MFS transporter [Anaeromyxobacter paludicola]BDG09344.1 MFS transporter [Anaeromyxobacter paludicola]